LFLFRACFVAAKRRSKNRSKVFAVFSAILFRWSEIKHINILNFLLDNDVSEL